MECLDGCTSSFDADLCIRCLYNRITQVVEDNPEIGKFRVATDSKHYGNVRFYERIIDAADQAYDRLDRNQMQHVLGMAETTALAL